MKRAVMLRLLFLTTIFSGSILSSYRALNDVSSSAKSLKYMEKIWWAQYIRPKAVAQILAGQDRRRNGIEICLDMSKWLTGM